MPGTTVCVRAGAAAMAHLPELDRLDVRTGKMDQEGFLELILSLDRVLPRQVANPAQDDYVSLREVGAGERLANPVRSGRKQP